MLNDAQLNFPPHDKLHAFSASHMVTHSSGKHGSFSRHKPALALSPARSASLPVGSLDLRPSPNKRGLCARSRGCARLGPIHLHSVTARSRKNSLTCQAALFEFPGLRTESAPDPGQAAAGPRETAQYPPRCGPRHTGAQCLTGLEY